MTEPVPPGTPARDLLSGPALPCGAEVDVLLEQAADGGAADLDDHQRGCVHCQAALREFAALWAPVAQFAAVPVPAPPGLTVTVMSQVRALVRDMWHTLHVAEHGTIRIAARVVAAMARESARAVPGVRAAFGRSTQTHLAALAEHSTLRHHHPGAAAGVLGQTAAVDLAVAVSYDRPVHETAREIQQHVITTLRGSLGLQAITVNITVDDILDDHTTTTAPRNRTVQPGPRAAGTPSDRPADD
jgi:uncharacterized alkaline shock family protein YloU